MISKKQNLLTKCFAKNKPVESTDYKAGLPDATSTEVSSQNTDEVSGSKAVCLFVFMVLKPLSKMSGSFQVSLVIYDSNNDTALEPETSSVFWLDTSVDVASGRPAL
jgi:hypothetical protein